MRRSNTMMAPPKALLFDLGGVLIDIDFARALNAWAPFSALSGIELRDAFQFDQAYERHERGELPSSEYFAHLRSALRLSASLREIEDGWNSIFVQEIATTRQLVQRVQQQLPCYAFTNTNGSHMARWSALFPEVVGSFGQIFASHQLGLRKPEPRAFQEVCRAMG